MSEGLFATVPFYERIGRLTSREIRDSTSFYYTGRCNRTEFHDEGPKAKELADFRERLVLMYMAKECMLIHGHFLFSDTIHRMSDGMFKYVTILRNPVARTISNYRMAVHSGAIPDDFDRFLDSAMGRRMSQHVLRYFSGRHTVESGDETLASEVAKTNILRFSVIGFLDDLKGFAEHFSDEFGVKPRFCHYNKAPGSKVELSAQQLSRLEELCAPDTELTDWLRRAS